MLSSTKAPGGPICVTLTTLLKPAQAEVERTPWTTPEKGIESEDDETQNMCFKCKSRIQNAIKLMFFSVQFKAQPFL